MLYTYIVVHTLIFHVQLDPQVSICTLEKYKYEWEVARNIKLTTYFTSHKVNRWRLKTLANLTSRQLYLPRVGPTPLSVLKSYISNLGMDLD